MAIIHNILNEFYANIRPELASSISDAISACENNGEFENNPALCSSFSQLITLLAVSNIPDSEAFNLYMTDGITRGSASRPFFYHMTTPSLLYPEDNPVYPPPPSPLPRL